jgi:small subunit ribosomal protein S3
MGQGFIRTDSGWVSPRPGGRAGSLRTTTLLLRRDLELKDSRERLKAAGVSSSVDRPGNKLRITIHTSRPGIVIGRKGAEMKTQRRLGEETKREVLSIFRKFTSPVGRATGVEIDCAAVRKRVAFRRHRKAADSALRFGCKGIKVRVSGRLNGAEIARTEWYRKGSFHCTRCAPISNMDLEAFTTYGVIGTVLVYKGEILPGGQRRDYATIRSRAVRRRGHRLG